MVLSFRCRWVVDGFVSGKGWLFIPPGWAGKPGSGARGDGNPRRKSFMMFGRDAARHDLVLQMDAGGSQESDVACHVLAAQQRRPGQDPFDTFHVDAQRQTVRQIHICPTGRHTLPAVFPDGMEERVEHRAMRLPVDDTQADNLPAFGSRTGHTQPKPQHSLTHHFFFYATFTGEGSSVNPHR